MTRTSNALLMALIVGVGLMACQSPARSPHAQMEAVSNPHEAGTPTARAGAGDPVGHASPRALELGSALGLEMLLPKLVDKDVIYVGETHDRYDHHLNQLAVIKALHREHGDIAIGAEFFQQPFQGALDAYIAGEIDEAQMLDRTEYFSRWGHDYRHYRPIMQYAQEQGIPVIALNASNEQVRQVGQQGLDRLSPEERAELPDIGPADEAYRKRLRDSFAAHGEGQTDQFERFVSVQLLWDEAMAERTADFVKQHPGRPLVVLAGSGHLAFGSGVPTRVKRRLDIQDAVLLNGTPVTDVGPKLADYLLVGDQADLPPAGKLGVLIESAQDGVKVTGFSDNSGARQAGVEKGDRIVAINDRRVGRLADLKVALMDRQPESEVDVTVRRQGWLGKAKEITKTVTLR